MASAVLRQTIESVPDILRELAQRKPRHPLYTVLSDSGSEAAVRRCEECDLRARALGAMLQSRRLTGERALLLFPPGMSFIDSFLGCLYAGVVAVPAYPPRNNRSYGRLRSIVADAAPRVALTTAAVLARLDPAMMAEVGLDPDAWIVIDECPDSLAGDWRPLHLGGDSLAFLQYTSGSTSTPKGVAVSHGNLLHNEALIQRAFRQDESSVVIGWLPLYHDMGLIGNVLQPLFSGSRCVLMSPLAFLQRPFRWLEAISHYRGTTSGGPNFAYDLCVRKVKPEQRELLDLSCWKVAFNGAEPVRAETLDRFAHYFAPSGFRAGAFFPCYGLAEATLMVTGLRDGADAPPVLAVASAALGEDRVTEPGEEEAGRAVFLVSSGRNPGGQRIAIVHPETRLECPPDRIGEIWVSGPCVAGGYWRQPEMTAEVFGARLADTGEGPFLRTGDLGFFQEGELFVTGRLKDLLILHGRNHYPQDIELTVESCHPALRPGCGAAFSLEVEGEERLVVVQEVDARAGVPFAALAALAALVARAVSEEHELQIHRLVLIAANRLLKTTSGKVQRQACRKAWLAGQLDVLWESPPGDEPVEDSATEASSGLSGDLALPLAAERRARLLDDLRLAVAGILRVAPERMDHGAPLSEVGLDSLRAVEIKSCLEERFGCAVDLGDLLQHESLEGLAGRILGVMGGGGAVSSSSRVEPGGEVSEHPLSYGQSSLWYLHRLSPESAAYNIAAAARIRGRVEYAALGQAFQVLLDRHPALRSRIVEEAGGPRVRVQRTETVSFEEEDAAAWDDTRLRERLVDEAHRPFDLSRGPLLRVRLLRRSDQELLLLLVVHHIAVDFWSLALLAEELGALYSTFAAGGAAPASPLPPLAYSYSDYVLWQQAELAGAAGERSWDYWRGRLTPEPPDLQLPADRPRTGSQTFRGAVHPFSLPPDLRARLKESGRREGATLSMVLLAAFQALLLRHGAEEDLALGMLAAGRTASAFASVVGYFVNPIVLRGELSGDPGFGQLVQRARRTVLESLEHQSYPFALLTEKLQPHRDPSRSSLFRALFVFQSARPGAEGLAGLALRRSGFRMELGRLTLESVELPQRTALFDLTLTAAEVEGGGLGLSLEYSTDLFEAATVARLAGRLSSLLAGAVSAPERRLSELPLLNEAECHQLLSEWNDTEHATPLALPLLHERFAEQASRTPERTAVVHGQESWSYAELASRVRDLAAVLAGLGAGPERPVGILLERTPDMVAALLGALSAGSAYLPLDPAYPSERLSFLVEDAGAELVLTESRLAGLARALPAERLCLDEPWPAVRRSPESAGPGSLAYLIYTSGSTGRPKGVAIEHRSVSAFLDWTRSTFSAVELAGVLASTSINFDLSVFELFAPLTTGGAVILARNALDLPALPAAGEVTLVNTVPSAASALLAAGGLPPSVRVLCLAGEPLPGDLVRRAYAESRLERVLNLYGPSEATTYSTMCAVERGEAGEPGIGRPILGTRGYVLDRSLRLVPFGVWGELYLAGLGLSRGYLGRPELTAERYVPSPFAEKSGARLYRTGDVVRQRRDGSLEYLGRADHQVKVRGFRIELGEIEAALRGAPRVLETVVMARPDVSGVLRLVAYVVAPEEAFSAESLQAHLRRSLPEHMVPAVFVRLESMPRTPNGKVDRSALPAAVVPEVETAYVAPRTSEEDLLACLWSDLLGVERVGVHDNFFILGGHSLLAVQLVSRLREIAGVEVPLRSLLEAPTVAGLAERLAEARRAVLPPLPEIVPVPRQGALPLSFAQERIWFLDRFSPESSSLNLNGAIALHGALDPGALESALAALAGRHEILRTRFEDAAGSPFQVVLPAWPAALPRLDLTPLPAAAQEKELRRLHGAEAETGFDLQAGPPWRACLVRMAETEHVLLLTLHHIVADGWSSGVILRDLGALYGAAVRGEKPSLPDLPVQYADYAHWQRELLQGERLERELAYWRQQLAGAAPLLDLPTDRPRPAVQTYRSGTWGTHLSPDLVFRLRGLGGREKATLFMTLLSLFKVLVHRWSGQADIVVGTPIAVRSRAELEPLVGLFLNSLALRTDLSGDPDFRQLLDRVRRTTLAAFSHQEVPFEKLLEELRPERDLSRTPLFQVFFNLLNFPALELAAQGLTLSSRQPVQTPAKFDLTVYLDEDAEGIHLSWVFNRDLFDSGTIVELAGQLGQLAQQAVEDPEERIGRFSLITAAARAVLPDPAAELSAEWLGAVHEVFSRQAARVPGQLAVAAPQESWTYGELAAQSNRLAHHLLAQGLGREDVVAIYGHRSATLVWTVLGVLKAGGAFAILDPSYPQSRIVDCLRVAEPRAWIELAAAGPVPEAVRSFLEPLPAGLRITLGTGAGDPRLADHAASDPGVPVGPDDLALIAFTSGSTGLPKGIAGRHGPLSHFIPWQCREFGLGGDDRFSMLSGLAHDPLQRDMFTPLQIGGTLCIPGLDPLDAPGWLAGWMERERITVAHLTPAMGQVLAEGGAERLTVPSLRYAFLVGEVLTRRDADRLRELAPHVSCVNFYGSTETQRSVGYYVVPPVAEDAAADRGKQVLPLGRGMQDVQLLVRNRAGQQAGVGELGEIGVRSPHLARGYLHDDALTAAKFIANPWGRGEAGDRVYQTGDLGRYRHDGTVVFAGRADQQVKIRGFRIELGEIEATLGLHPALQEVAAAVWESRPGEKILVAYFVPRPGEAPPADGLRDFVRERLPHYMVPAAYVPLERLPLTSNRKLDRRALPAPEREAGEDQVAPRGPVEEILAGIWAELLGIERIGVHDDFFGLGGHSLLATRVLSRTRDALGVELPLRQLFGAPTVAALARQVELARAELSELPPLPPIPPPAAGPRPAELPLSFSQERLWLLEQIEGAGAAYNIPCAVQLAGSLDTAALGRALDKVVCRHEVLRTRFAAVSGKPEQLIEPPSPVPLPVVDVTGCSASEALRLACSEAARPFDLTRSPLLRACLLRRGAEDHLLVLVLHHIAADGWSVGVLVRELVALYQGKPLADLPLQYADFALWQRRWLSDEILAQEISWWRERLTGAPEELPLPTDRPRPAAPSSRGGNCRTVLPLAAELGALCRERQATLFMVLLAAFAALLSRYSGEEDLVVGSPVAHRDRVETEGLIGFFVNMLPLRVDLTGQPTFITLLARVQEGTLAAYSHQGLPFEKLVEALQPARHLSRTPLFQVCLTLQHAPFGIFDVPGLSWSPLPLETGAAKFDLSLSLTEAVGGLSATLEHRTDLFEPVMMLRLLGHFRVLLEAAAADPGLRLPQLPLLTAAEVHQLHCEWNDASSPNDDLCVHDLVFAQARRTPQALAVRCGAERLTYEELAARVRRLAAHLRAQGIARGSLVGLAVDRSAEMVVALLGILATGAAYVPLDPTFPPERLALMIQDARPALLLTEERLAGALPAGSPRFFLERVGGEPVGSRAETILSTPGNLAYVLYTSGSTGRPKGVAIPHRTLVSFLAAVQRSLGVAAHDALLALTTLSFDIAALEIFLPLSVGATVVVATRDDARGGAELRAALSDPAVTVMQATPATWRLLLESGWEGNPRLKALCGGEALLGELADRLLDSCGELWNLYGPTETTVWSMVQRVRSRSGHAGTVPVGRPLSNTAIHLLDRGSSLVAIGVPGELWIGGAGLALGYLGRPDLTAAAFRPDPFAAEPGARLYRTGDLARRLPDGTVEFLGRIDHQVKVRGFRIELGEIESHLSLHPGVQEVVATVHEGTRGDRRVVAYLVAASRPAPTADELRRFLAEALPEYMLPSAWVWLEALPLTPNGKVDRKALPRPEAERPELSVAYVAPRSELEQTLAAVWCEILEAGEVGIHDNFFQLGGHSLLGTRLMARIESRLGVALPLRTLFEAPTVATLAGRLEEALERDSGYRPVPPLVAVARPAVLPLSFAQERLLFLDQLESGSPFYNMPAALRLTGPLDTSVLKLCLSEILRRHEALRTVFAIRERTPVQVIRPAAPCALPVVDLAGLPESLREAQALVLAREEVGRPFDFAEGPLLRGILLRLAEEDHVVTLTLHHIASDAWSMGILVREVMALYAAFSAGRPSPLPELPLQYADFAVWQRQCLQGEVLDELTSYWHGRLAGAPPLLRLATDRARPARQSHRGAHLETSVPSELGRRIARLADLEGGTVFMVLLGAVAVLLHQSSGQEDLVVGTPFGARPWVEVEGLIGFFVNALPLRIDLSGNPTFHQLLAGIRQSVIEALMHQHLPFEKLVEKLQPERDLGYNPLFQVTFNLIEGDLVQPLALPGLKVTSLPVASEFTPCDLNVNVFRQGHEITATFQYSTDLFDALTIAWMGEDLLQVLDTVTAEPETPLSLLGKILRESDERRRTVLAKEVKRAQRESFNLRQRRAMATLEGELR